MRPQNDAPLGERAEKAKQTLEELLRLMGIEAKVTVATGEEEIMLAAEGDGEGIIIGKKGQTLDALQFIVSRIVSRTHPGPHHIIVDAEGYRDRRADQLRSMAHQVAQRVREERVPYAFDPSLNGAERRIVHMELKDEPDLSTQSEGEGDRRRLVVYPRSSQQ